MVGLFSEGVGWFFGRITLKGTFAVSGPIVVWQTNSSARICVVEDNVECGDSGLHVLEPSTACRFGRTCTEFSS